MLRYPVVSLMVAVACTGPSSDPSTLGDTGLTVDPPTSELEGEEEALGLSAGTADRLDGPDVRVFEPGAEPPILLHDDRTAGIVGGDCLTSTLYADLPVSTRQLASLPHGRLLLVESHGADLFDPTTGDLTELDHPDFSWTMAAAWDSARDVGLVVDLGGSGQLYEIDLVTADVTVAADLQNVDATAMTYHADQDVLFVMETRSASQPVSELLRFETDGSPLGPLVLSGDPLPGAGQVDSDGLAQMVVVGEDLVVVHHPGRDWSNSTAYTIDPVTGDVWVGAVCP